MLSLFRGFFPMHFRGSGPALVESVPRMPSTLTPDPALELARLDETRSLLAQLLQLATRREAALTAQTEGLRVPPRASDAGDSSSLLSSAMEDQPNFLASSSLLGPPPGTQVLEARTEEKFQRLAQAQAHAHTCTHHTHSPQPPLPLPCSSTRRSRTSRCLLPPSLPAAAARRQAHLVQRAHGGHASASRSDSSAS